MQASRKFEQNDAEAFLLQAGAEDANPHSDFSQDISLHGSADDLPSSQPARPQSAQVGQAKERAGARPSRFNLQQAIHAKPFVPKSLSGQQVWLFLQPTLFWQKRLSSLEGSEGLGYRMKISAVA